MSLRRCRRSLHLRVVSVATTDLRDKIALALDPPHAIRPAPEAYSGGALPDGLSRISLALVCSRIVSNVSALS